jgi:hypothetical protein
MTSNIGWLGGRREWIRRRLRQEESVAQPQFDASSNGSEVGEIRNLDVGRWSF